MPWHGDWNSMTEPLGTCSWKQGWVYRVYVPYDEGTRVELDLSPNELAEDRTGFSGMCDNIGRSLACSAAVENCSTDY